MTITERETAATPSTRRAAPAGGLTRGMRVRSVSAQTAKYTSLVVAAVLTLLPLTVLLFASFKTKQEYGSTGPFDAPSSWLNFDNFVTAFTSGKMLEGFVNTSIVMALFLVATLIPSVTSQVATFQLINGLGLYDTKAALILLFMGTDVIALYLFIQFMQSIPMSLDEAAMIDGANRWTIYWRIVLPLLRPAIATVVIIKGIAVYNEFYAPFLYLPSEGLISTSLFRFKGPFGAQWEVIAAGTIVVIIPTLIAFLLLQRWIYRGLTSGAVK